MGTKHVEMVGYRKVGIALTAALSCFLLYVLACVFSSPSWSPDSTGIALLVTSGDLEEPNQFAIFTYDIRTDAHVLLDQADANVVLSSPAWSPDGKWIAYYRWRRPPSQGADAPVATRSAGSEPNQPAGTGQAAGSKADAAEPFSEENKMLPPFVFDALREQTKDEDYKMFRAELAIVTPAGKDRKILQTLQWPVSGNASTMFPLLRPQWSKDSRRLFYTRQVGEVSYIAGLDLATGQTCAYVVSLGGTFAISPDGDWMASLLNGDSKQVLLSVARTDGSVLKCFRLDAEMGEGSDSSPAIIQLSWSPDSKYILASLKELCIIDVMTGQIRKYDDPEADEIAWGVFSPQGERLYYLAQFQKTDPNAKGEKVALRSHDLGSGETQTVLTPSDIPAYNGIGRFSISPDGKVISLWCSVDEDGGREESVLLLWDSKTQKMVKTSAWLPKPATSASPSPAKPEKSER